MGWLLNAIPRWLAGQVAAALNRLWGLLSGTVLWVPDVTALPQVQRLTGTSLAVVNTGFVLAVIAAGVTVMTRRRCRSATASASWDRGWWWRLWRRTWPGRSPAG